MLEENTGLVRRARQESSTTAANSEKRADTMKLNVGALIPTVISVLLLSCSYAVAEPPPTYEAAKELLADVHEKIGHLRTFYCDCPYVRRGDSNGDVDRGACGFKARTDEQNKGDIEWEHVAPASWFGDRLPCWTKGHRLCKRRDGTPYKGRPCCEKPRVDEAFVERHNDPHNLFPAVMEVNNHRRNHPFGTVAGEPRAYGACDFEVDGRLKLAEPAKCVRGEIARALLYMMERYEFDVKMSREELTRWNEGDPPEAWECDRARLIQASTGLANEFVKCSEKGERTAP